MNVRAAGAVLLLSSAFALTACGTTQSAGPATDSAGGSTAASASDTNGMVESDNTGSDNTGSSKTGSSTKAPAAPASKQATAPGQTPCTAHALNAAPGILESSEDPGKGKGYGYVNVKNTSGQPCLLKGYPNKITLQTSSGSLQTQVITDKAPAAADITLGAGEWAGFSVEWKSGSLDCEAPHGLLVNAPDGDTIPVTANMSGGKDPMHVCDDGNTLHVSGWKPGSAPN